MICKGNTHQNGAKLARYITMGKDGERAELYELRGFASDDIRDAFRSVHVMAAATKCEQPFFHVQVRNPEDEELTRAQWRYVADRIEKKLGLEGQPRAIAFHTDEVTGHEHMHVAWGRIDEDTMTARPLPFFKERLLEVARELEKELGLTRVRSDRDGSVQAPSRNEFEQARRLGVDIREVRQTIRDCWDRSDCGRSFEAALADEGLLLAKGDRRDLVVIDEAGGLHALSKRVLGISAAAIRSRTGDVSPDHLLTVEQARERVKDSREQVPWDRDRADRDWQDAVARAAIEKEKTPRPSPGRKWEGETRVWETTYTTVDRFKETGREVAGGNTPEKPFTGIEKRLWDAYRSGPDPRDFSKELDRQGLAFARVTPEEAYKSHREAQFARAVGRWAPLYLEGELVVVQSPSPEYLRQGEWTALNRVKRLDQTHAEKYLAILGLDESKLKGIEATRAIMQTGAQERAAYWESIRIESGTRIDRFAPRTTATPKTPAALGKVAERTVGKALDLVGNALEAVLAPVLTPEQKRQGAITQAERSRDAKEKVEFDTYLADLAAHRRRREEELAPDRRKERDDRDR